MSVFWSVATKEFRKKLALLLNLIFIFVFLIQFPVSCVDTGEGIAVTVEDDGFAGYFGGKTPDDILTGFAGGFIVQLRPDVSPARFFADGPVSVPVEKTLASIHSVTMHLTLDELRELTRDDAVIWISPDSEVRASWYYYTLPDSGFTQVTTGTDQVQDVGQYAGRLTFSDWTGDDVAVALLDSGIDLTHSDLRNQVVASVDFTDAGDDGATHDPYGHGTHVAGLIAGTGQGSYNDSYDRFIAGVAPETKLVNLRVLDANGAGTVSDVIEAIEWAVEHRAAYNTRVINLSLGLPPMSSYQVDPLARACAAAVAEGMVVVAATGNYGDYSGTAVYGGITSPAYSPYVVAVGAADTNDTDERSDDSVAPFSSKGPTLYDGLAKPDLVAPGVWMKAAFSEDGYLYAEYPDTAVDPCDEGSSQCWLFFRPETRYQRLSGTSMAAPVVSGTVAMMLQANPSLTPNAVKAILMGTAEVLDGEPYVHQGAGLLNVEGAVRLASKISDLDEVSLGAEWTVEDVEPVSEIAGEQIVWSLGVGWTGSIVIGTDVVFVYQPVYAYDVVWGQGVGWTGSIVVGTDPVWDDTTTPIWTGGVLDPLSLPYAGEDVLVGSDLAWDGEPDFIDESNPAYPHP